MTSSSYFELILAPTGRARERFTTQRWEIPEESTRTPVLDANRPAEITLRRGSATATLRVRLESEELFRLPPERSSWTVQLGDSLRDQYGLADLVVEEAADSDTESWSPALQLTLRIEADPEFRRLHEALVRELEEVHLLLARDIVSRSWQRRDRGGVGEVQSFSAENDLEQLDSVCERLEKALARIGEQPSRSLRRTRVMARWRPGDPIGSLAAHRMALEGKIRRDPDGRIYLPPKLLMDRPVLATDIEEHRHLRSGLLRLAERSAALSRYCSRARHLLEDESARWTGPAYEQKARTRLDGLESIQSAAEQLHERFRRLLTRQAFLEGLGPPRTTLRPTPIFSGRPAYRDAFRALRDARRNAGGRFDGGGLRVRFRNLPTLYEYWLFVQVVGTLRAMCGVPIGKRAFTLIDEVYRPELAPGQQFVFRLPRGETLTATYEPDFPPAGRRGAGGRYRAALVSGTLRPDVTIELAVPGRAPMVLVLDAKSGPRFHRPLERLRDVADYVHLIHDPATGHQPVRQLFLVHRDRDSAPVCTLTGYLEGRVTVPDSRILGAIPAQPGETENLRLVISRFLETYRSRRRR